MPTDPAQTAGVITGEGVDTLLDQVDTLLQSAYGFTLPEGTTGDNLVERLGIVLSMTGQLSGEASDETDPNAPPVDTVAMSNPFRRPAPRRRSPAEKARIKLQLQNVRRRL